MNQKAVSIILPVYNVERYIAKCLDSIINQSYKDFELIIIDDCGQDNSIEICRKKLIETDIDYKIILNPSNFGLSMSRNIGLRKSTGKYILFIDSDDWVNQRILEHLHDAAEMNDADIVSCSASYFWEDSGSCSEIQNLAPGIYAADSYLNIYFEEKVNLEAWGRLFRREIFDTIEFPSKVNNEDLLTLPFLIRNSKKIVQIRNPLYYYVQREAKDSITDSKPTNIEGFLSKLSHFKRFDAHSKKSKLNSKKFAYKNLLAVTAACIFHAKSYQEVKEDIGAANNFIELRDLIHLFKGVPSSTLPLTILLKLNPYLFFKAYKAAR